MCEPWAASLKWETSMSQIRIDLSYRRVFHQTSLHVCINTLYHREGSSNTMAERVCVPVGV